MLITDKESLSRLKRHNKLALTEAEDADTLAFLRAKNAELSAMNAVNTEKVKPMVHVMPTVAVVREDKATTRFTRDELQSNAHDTHKGYLCVPLLVE